VTFDANLFAKDLQLLLRYGDQGQQDGELDFLKEAEDAPEDLVPSVIADCPRGYSAYPDQDEQGEEDCIDTELHNEASDL
jgi:hypothetical protein